MSIEEKRNALNDEDLNDVSGGYTLGRDDMSGVDILDNKTGEILYTVTNKKKKKVMDKNKQAGMLDAYEEAAKLDQQLNRSHLG